MTDASPSTHLALTVSEGPDAVPMLWESENPQEAEQRPRRPFLVHTVDDVKPALPTIRNTIYAILPIV